MRVTVAVLAGLAVAFLSAVALGEYPFTGIIPYAAAIIVPSLVVAVMTGLGRSRPYGWWLLAAPLGAAGIALGVWFAGGRGLAPWPPGGTVAIVVALLWPLVVVAERVRSSGRPQRPLSSR